MRRASAQAALDRRCAAAALAGAALGKLPLLWLLREALDAYATVAITVDYTKHHSSTLLLRVGGHELWLEPWNAPRLLCERDALGSFVRAHEVPNAALVLYDAVKAEPGFAERLLVTIEAAAKDVRR